MLTRKRANEDYPVDEKKGAQKRKREGSDIEYESKKMVKKEEISVKAEDVDSDEYSDFEEFDTSRYDISEYELLRKENIKKNMEMFEEFNVSQAKHEFNMTSKKKKAVSVEVVGLQSKKEKVVRPTVPTRKSLRIQKLEADPIAFQPHYVFAEPIVEHERKPEKMSMEVMNDIEKSVCDSAVKTWSTINKVKTEYDNNNIGSDFKRYKKDVKALVVQHVGKVTKHRIFSLAIHPMQEKVLAVAGDKLGGVGIWDVDSNNGKNEVFLFEPHSSPINCLKFAPFDCNKLFSCSYDGTIRFGDFQHQSFTQVYGFDEDEDKRFNYFAWPGNKPDMLLAATSTGELLQIDTKSGKAENTYKLHQKSLRCVDCHPLKDEIFVAACFDGTVATWDLRMMSHQNNNFLSSFRAGKTVSTCFLSPKSGDKLLMTSQDDYLRVLDVKKDGCFTTPPTWPIRHNNFTGRWLTTFRACWDPKTDNCFVCGSMSQPRQIDIFGCGLNGQLSSFNLQHEYLTSVGSVNVFHPVRNVLISGNASGKVFIWK